MTCQQCGAVLATPDIQLAPIDWPQDWEFDDEVWRRAIGPNNTDYYLRRFRVLFESEEDVFFWHWSALFSLVLFWLLHRKMWAWAMGYAVWVVSYGIWIGMLVFRGEVGSWTLFDYAFPLLLGQFVAPKYVNSFYYAHVKDLIAREKEQYKSRAIVLGRLETSGGTSKAGVAGAVLVAAIAVVVASVFAVSSVHVRIKRTQARTAVTAATTVVDRVDAYVRRNRRLPPNVDALAAGASGDEHIASIELNPVSGVLVFDVAFGHGSSDGQIFFRPSTANWATPNVSWTCDAEGDLRQYVPEHCLAGRSR